MLPASSHIANYRILRVLGEGGMGTVYEGMHDGIGRRVAIKVLHAEFARKPEFVKRFLNEARAVNLVPHPGMVQISECGQAADGTAYLVMEYLDGETLSARLQRNNRKLTEEQAIGFAWQLAAALAAAHSSGIVHRDLKPGNVMLVKDPSVLGGERVKLLDFGIAKLGQQLGRPDGVSTRTGVTMGTPLYMAPEQCLGAANVDGKADVYSLGVMMFEMLAGEPPFVAEVDLVLMNMHLSKAPPALRQLAPGVSDTAATLVQRMLSKAAGDRPTMAEVARTLQEFGTGLPQKRTPAPETTDEGETRLLLRDSATFRPSGERHTVHGKRRPLAAVGAGLGLTAAVVLAGWVTLRDKVPVPLRPPSSPAVAPGLPPQEESPKPPAAAAARNVTSRITSQPAGAMVVRLGDNQVLGMTPWRREQPAQTGELLIQLKLPGYRPKLVTLRLDEDTNRSEALAAEPTPRKAHPVAHAAPAASDKRPPVPPPAAKAADRLRSPQGNNHDPASRIID